MIEFQSFWFGDSLPPYQQLAMKSFIDHGHSYVLYTYEKFDVPAGVRLRDAAEILPQSRVFFYGERAGVGKGSVAAFSNLFRWYLLHERGGWWVDTDVVCLSGIIPSSEVFFGREINEMINNAILRFPAGHQFVKELCELAEQAGTDLFWGENGCALLDKLVYKRDLSELAASQSFAYPVQSVDALRLLVPSQRDKLNEMITGRPFLHMSNEVMRRAVVFPWMGPPQGSLMAELFERHGFDFSHSQIYTAEQIQRLGDNYYAAATWSHGIAERAEVARLQTQVDALTAEIEQLRRQTRGLQTRMIEK